MHHMCTKCYGEFEEYQLQVINQGYVVSYCPSPKCNGSVVEVDELILPTIIELNKKGYTTKYCCSGHLNQGMIGTYLYFEVPPKSCPEGFHFRSETTFYIDNFNRNLTGIEGFEELVQINLKLYRWALKLPKAKINYAV
ncbi:hypothetical protein Q7A53_05405 [Halobacillus rhizosphaerae]|uniref:hypothetical protein n=1 Tax=Halobacillus rhizosphaerae TaxID=3064889 RepID=UPI00398AF80C